MAAREEHNSDHIKGWDRQEVYVLTALQELKDNQKEFKQEVQDVKDAVTEVAKNILSLHGKFDQYNNFNQRLFQFDNALLVKQKELAETKDKLNTLEKATADLKLRVTWIVGGISLVVTSIVTLAINLISAGFSPGG